MHCFYKLFGLRYMKTTTAGQNWGQSDYFWRASQKHTHENLETHCRAKPHYENAYFLTLRTKTTKTIVKYNKLALCIETFFLNLNTQTLKNNEIQ